MQEIIAKIIRERLSDASIIKLLDGAVIFKTACSYDRLNFFCFSNIFAVIDMQDADSAPGLHMRKIADAGKKGGTGAALSEKALAVISENNRKIKTFRLVCSVENRPASVSESLRLDMENFIAEKSALKADRSGADTEFWFLCRREGFSVFMKRLSNHGSKEKNLHRGELSPQLAWLLCRLGDLKPGETVIDPFCGYGSIPEAAVKHFPIGKFIASDTDSGCVKITRSRSALKSARCEIRVADVFAVSAFVPACSVDAVITDPPWGMYRETKEPLGEFYSGLLALFAALLKPGGRAVILTAAADELKSAAGKTQELKLTQTYSILVSGKKAQVFVIRKEE